MPRQNEPEITWTIHMDQANTILSVLAQQPFERVAELIVDLRNQAQAQLQSFQQQNNTAGMTPLPRKSLLPNGASEAP